MIDDVCSHQFRPRFSTTNDVYSHQFRPCSSTTNNVCLKQFRPRSSTIDDVCSHQFRPRSSTTNDASLFNDKWRLLETLQAPLLKEKKGVRSSALYLQKKRNLLVFDHSHQHSSFSPMLVQSLSGSTSGLVQNSISPKTYVPPSKRDYEILFQPLFDEYFNPPPCAVSPDLVAVAAPRPVDPADLPLSTTIDQDVPSASTSPTNQEILFQVTHQGVEEQIHGHQNAQFDNAPLLYNLPSDLSSEETTLQGVIPSNLHHLNQSFNNLTKFIKNHPLKNVIGNPSRL
ncbi:hypothetical protein Tco_1489966, partial [Tanacetum coccineum]